MHLDQNSLSWISPVREVDKPIISHNICEYDHPLRTWYFNLLWNDQLSFCTKASARNVTRVCEMNFLWTAAVAKIALIIVIVTCTVSVLRCSACLITECVTDLNWTLFTKHKAQNKHTQKEERERERGIKRERESYNQYDEKQEEQVLEWSIFTILTGFLHSHLPYILNHYQHLSCFIMQCKTQWLHKF